MTGGLFPFKKAFQVFGADTDDRKESALPEFARSTSDNRQLKSWSLKELPAVGAKVGFMKKPTKPVAAAIFVTKGGVLKSSLTLNFARMAALHGIRTCVVGLDMQADVTTALGGADPDETETSLKSAVERMNAMRGLAEIFTGAAKVTDVVRPTEIPTLFYIPETPELVALDQSLINRNRREYWLRDNVIAPLRRDFDLILMDCSPNWNRLITNALVASDVLISPLECKINNYRNMATFRALISEFQADMRVKFEHVYVATRLSPSRTLSREIFDWYEQNLDQCLKTPIRESIQGEEAMAMKISIPEYAPTSAAADEMRAVLCELWPVLLRTGAKAQKGDSAKRRFMGRTSDLTM